MVTHSVAFDVRQPGAYAVQLRLTPALLEALLAAQDDGQPVSIRFGQGTQGGAITVAGAPFPFNALPEGAACDVLSLPPATPGSGAGHGGALLGAVRQKLMVLRNIEDERERVRARAEEAERRGHERKALLLHGRPTAAGKRRPTTTTVQRVTPPPSGAVATAAQHQRQRGPTPPPQQLTASMLAPAQPPAARPPAHPASAQQCQRARSATPPPTNGGAAAPGSKPMHKSASTSRLGGKQGAAAAAGGTAGKQTASALVLQAARSGAGLRLMLIAMLSERQMGPTAVKNALADVAARVRSFKQPSKHELERVLKAVAEFKSPGTYVLYPMLLQELSQLTAASSLSPPDSHQSGEAPAGGGAAGGRKQKKRAAAAAAGDAAGGAAPSPPAGSEGAAAAGKAAAAAGSKRGRYDWTDDDSDAEQPPAAPQLRIRAKQQQEHAQVSAPAAPAGTGSAASPPSIGGAPAGGGGSSGGGVRRTSSNRGSQQADESWIEDIADRQPEPAAPITSREDFAAREAAFDAKYKVYFDLHQLIQAHKKDFEALAAAAAEACSPADRERLRSELERLHRQRGERAKRWDQAFRVLHQELAADKARMAEFVASLQAQHAQQAPQPGPAAGGGPPAVRVN